MCDDLVTFVIFYHASQLRTTSVITICQKPTQGGDLGGILTNRDDGRCTELRSVVEYYERDQIITHI